MVLPSSLRNKLSIGLSNDPAAAFAIVAAVIVALTAPLSWYRLEFREASYGVGGRSFDLLVLVALLWSAMVVLGVVGLGRPGRRRLVASISLFVLGVASALNALVVFTIGRTARRLFFWLRAGLPDDVRNSVDGDFSMSWGGWAQLIGGFLCIGAGALAIMGGRGRAVRPVDAGADTRLQSRYSFDEPEEDSWL